MASDFHTHHLPANDCRGLISTTDFISGAYISLENHPWYLPEKYYSLPVDFADKLADYSALGEIGLDKLHGPELSIQCQYLEELFQLAQDMNKPVVLHIVRCYQELFAILKRYSLRVMVHGFNGSPELLNELWKRDITVSFAPQILHKPELLTKLSAPAGKFGFESDNSPDISVKQILSQTGIKNIENMTDQYFNDFLEI